MIDAHALNNKCFDLPFPLNTEPRINKFASALVVSVPSAALNRLSDLLVKSAHILFFVACCLKSTPLSFFQKVQFRLRCPNCHDLRSPGYPGYMASIGSRESDEITLKL